MTDRPKILAPTHNFKRGDKVLASAFVGAQWVWADKAQIIGKPHSISETSGFWWPVRFADGGKLCVHECRLIAAQDAQIGEAVV